MTTSLGNLGDDSQGGSVVLEGFTDHLDKTSFEGEFVGNFSGLARDHDGTIAALSDRSMIFRLDPETLNPIQVIQLRDELRQRIDCEAMVFDEDTILVATERPEILQFNREGKLLGAISVPSLFRVTPIGKSRLNESLEGLTLLPGGQILMASMENALISDADQVARFQTWERADPNEKFIPAAQYPYLIDPGLLVSDIAAVGDDRLLVLERGFDNTGNKVKLYLADLRGAADVSALAEIDENVPVISKQLLVDMVDLPTSGAVAKQAQVNALLGNIEAMVVTDVSSEGEVRVLLATDDNTSDAQITRMYRLLVRLPARS